MSPTSNTNKIKSLLNLIRFNKPTGFLLLMWPCWFALACLPIKNIDMVKWYFLFFIGSFLMRSAGCIINDLIDIKIDKKVQRTAERPLVNKNVSIYEASTLLGLLLFCSLIILLQFNFNTIIISLLSIPLIIIYPYMKRFTYWPQLMLGIVFSWGVLIVSIQFNDSLSSLFIILYIGCIFWTLGYDTIYAYQDIDDDINNNIKSTAVFFGNNGKKYVLLFYIIFLIILGYIGYKTSSSIISIITVILFLFALVFILTKWNIRSRISANNYFKLNNFFGFCCFIYLVVF